MSAGNDKPYCTVFGTYKIRGDGRNLPIVPSILLSMFIERESHTFVQRFKTTSENIENEIDNLKNILKSKVEDIKDSLTFEINTIHESMEESLQDVKDDLGYEMSNINDELTSELGSTQYDLEQELKNLISEVRGLVISLNEHLESWLSNNAEHVESTSVFSEQNNDILNNLYSQSVDILDKINELPFE